MEFARRYGDKNPTDFRALQAARKNGQLTVAAGV